MRKTISILLAATAAAGVVGLTSAGSASASSACWLGHDGLYYCNNVRGTVVYDDANVSLRPTHPMWSNPSSFFCKTDVPPGHPGYYWGNHPGRWLWTQADDGSYGAMKDTDIYSETDTVGNCP